MCKECGCGGSPGHEKEHANGHEHDHEHAHHHHHHHDHGHGHSHNHDHDHDRHSDSQTLPPAGRRTLEMGKAILDKNDRLAERNRGFFRAHDLLVLNVLSSPGAGKTTLLSETIRRLQPGLRCGVIVGDLATDNDGRRLRETGVPVVQITTGTVCHLEAEMVARHARELDLKSLDVLIIENVGNLVCPACYDLGEDLRIVLFSVTEGEDKPLKYPPMFQSANIVIISKTDLSAPCGFNRTEAMANLNIGAPGAQIFEVSAKTGEGMESWCEFLERQSRASRQLHC